MLLEVQGHTVPHLKALFSAYKGRRGLMCGSTLTLCHTLLKKASLLHKEAAVRILNLGSVDGL